MAFDPTRLRYSSHTSSHVTRYYYITEDGAAEVARPEYWDLRELSNFRDGRPEISDIRAFCEDGVADVVFEGRIGRPLRFHDGRGRIFVQQADGSWLAPEPAEPPEPPRRSK